MDKFDADLLKKIQHQFNSAPYPRNPVEQSPKNDGNLLYLHNLTTASYVRNKTIAQPQEKIILDAGCGTGYASLVLAEANPGAKIIGIDISEQSIELAHTRLKYHGFDTAEFYALALEDLPTLKIQFDYINIDEVLYLVPDPVRVLGIMQSVLSRDGIIRANLHSCLQRSYLFQAQHLFKLMGLMEGIPGVLEVEVVRETMMALKEVVSLRKQTWDKEYETNNELLMMNYLLQGDKGYSIPELFAALKTANLEFISMVNRREWDLMELFQEPENLPAFLSMSLPIISIEEQLHLFELLHPVHRLLDFWCGHPNQTPPSIPVSEWKDSDWERVRVHLHPQLRIPQLREDLIYSITHHQPWEVSRYVTAATLNPIYIESDLAACLLPLWDSPQPMKTLVERWLQIRPVHPTTLEPATHQTAFDQVKQLLSDLEAFIYVLLEVLD